MANFLSRLEAIANEYDVKEVEKLTKDLADLQDQVVGLSGCYQTESAEAELLYLNKVISARLRGLKTVLSVKKLADDLREAEPTEKSLMQPLSVTDAKELAKHSTSIKKRRALLDLYVRDVPVEEVAKKQGASVDAVKHRARRYLGFLLERDRERRTRIVSRLRGKSALRTPVDELELSISTARHLRENGLATVGNVVARSTTELKHSMGFSHRNVVELRSVLAELGVSMRDF